MHQNAPLRLSSRAFDRYPTFLCESPITRQNIGNRCLSNQTPTSIRWIVPVGSWLERLAFNAVSVVSTTVPSCRKTRVFFYRRCQCPNLHFRRCRPWGHGQRNKNLTNNSYPRKTLQFRFLTVMMAVVHFQHLIPLFSIQPAKNRMMCFVDAIVSGNAF